MNRIKQLVFFFAMSAIIALSSCSGEVEDLVTPDPPTVSLADQAGLTTSEVRPGTTVTFVGTAFGNANIATANIYVDQVQSKTYAPSGLTQFQFPAFTYTVTEADKGMTINITYEAIDVNGKQGEASYSLKVLADTPLAYESTGAILGNKIGPTSHLSAWNLVANVREAAGAATSDMQNPSIATGTVAQQWIKGWDGENGSMFVKSNAFDYANATVESTTAAYAEGSASATVRNLVVGDIYIAKLRNKEAYAVIQITRVDNAVTAGSSRLEEIQFSYKKELATSGQ